MTAKRKGRDRAAEARRWYVKHTVAECPAWRPTFGPDVAGAVNVLLAEPGPGDPIWSGWGTVAAPPAVGAIVATRADLGSGVVFGYMVQAGPAGSRYLGVVLALVAPPAWYAKQNGEDSLCLIYGAELDGNVAPSLPGAEVLGDLD